MHHLTKNTTVLSGCDLPEWHIDCRTKFIGGHEDLCAGVLTTRTSQQWKKIRSMRILLGGILVRNMQ